MQYRSTEEIAKKWRITRRRVAILAKEGRIPGALRVGTRWMIPENAVKPLDGRTGPAKENEGKTEFRFPLYLDLSEEEFCPPLSEEEKLLKKAQEYFYACDFGKAEELLRPLSETAGNSCVYISVLIHLSLLYLATKRIDPFEEAYRKLSVLPSGNDPNLNEILLLKYMFDCVTGAPRSLFKDFAVEMNYEYHPSSLGILSVLSLYTTISGDITNISRLRFDPFEALCKQLESDGKFFEAQFLHIQLTFAYQMQGKKECAAFHLRNAVRIAEERNLIYLPAVNVTYLSDVFQTIVPEFPAELIKKIRHYARMAHEGYALLGERLKTPDFYCVLSKNEYQFVYLGTQGYTNRKIAEIMNTTAFYVSKRYSAIYRKLGVNSKKELIALFESGGMNETAGADPFYSERNMDQIRKADAQVKAGNVVAKSVEELENLADG